MLLLRSMAKLNEMNGRQVNGWMGCGGALPIYTHRSIVYRYFIVMDWRSGEFEPSSSGAVDHKGGGDRVYCTSFGGGGFFSSSSSPAVICCLVYSYLSQSESHGHPKERIALIFMSAVVGRPGEKGDTGPLFICNQMARECN